jgi:hypothetical protein
MDLELMTAAAGRDPDPSAVEPESAPDASADALAARLAEAGRVPTATTAARERKREGDV